MSGPDLAADCRRACGIAGSLRAKTPAPGPGRGRLRRGRPASSAIRRSARPSVGGRSSRIDAPQLGDLRLSMALSSAGCQQLPHQSRRTRPLAGTFLHGDSHGVQQRLGVARHAGGAWLSASRFSAASEATVVGCQDDAGRLRVVEAGQAAEDRPRSIRLVDETWSTGGRAPGRPDVRAAPRPAPLPSHGRAAFGSAAILRSASANASGSPKVMTPSD